MPALAVYILKLSVSLAVVFLFYRLLLHRLTFYNWNRWYLLGYTLLAFCIPFIDITPVLNKNELSGNSLVTWVPQINSAPVTANVSPETTTAFSLWNMVSMLMLLGMVIMLVRLLIQFVSFRRMMQRAECISDSDMKIFHVDENIIPFSFGNSIFINRELHSPGELQEIIRHEFVHVRQVHSIDIIWGEVLCLLNWYNPFAWLLKQSIRQNLEFIADHKVLENGIAKKEYQYLLLKVIGNNQYSIATQFNFSSLKKRIAMMNKLKSARVHLVKFLFILPVLGIILVSFRKQMIQAVPENRVAGINKTAVVKDTLPERKKLPSNVKGIDIDNNKATVNLKNGTREEYDLDIAAEKNAFENKYGEILPPPPPPPPAPPTPPGFPAPPAPPTAPTPPPPPPKLPDNVQRISVHNDNATVWLKNGSKETYDLSVPAQKENFEKKYGKVQPVPPVPPVPEISPVPAGTPVPDIAPVARYQSDQNNKLSVIAKEFEITDKKAWLRLKNGTVEEYDLTNKAERKKFEDRYGKIYAAEPVRNGTVTPVAYTGGRGQTVIVPMAPRSGEDPLIVDDYGYTITGNEDILITITKNTTRAQLEEFKRKMKEKDIELKFDNIDYNDGILVSISGSMISKDGRSNFVATDFNKLVLAMIKKGERTYFKVSTSDRTVHI